MNLMHLRIKTNSGKVVTLDSKMYALLEGAYEADEPFTYMQQANSIVNMTDGKRVCFSSKVAFVVVANEIQEWLLAN